VSVLKKLESWRDNIIPKLWGWLWVLIITIGSMGCLLCVVKWSLKILGIM
jgi:hypothetical protein